MHVGMRMGFAGRGGMTVADRNGNELCREGGMGMTEHWEWQNTE
jgi:hypothetical protein